jgi:hypothetical protein
MVNIWSWSTTAATNSNADGGINWAEGQLPPTVNDSARAMMQRVAQLLRDMGGVNVTTGTANAQLLAPTGTWNSNSDGRRGGFTAGFTNTGAMTLNISSVGAAAVLLNNAALTGGEVVAGAHYEFVYHTASGSRLAGFHLISGRQAVLSGTAASTIVVADNSNPALRVTQTGTANVVLFEDSANPDSSPWLIDGNGVQVKGHTAALTTFLDWAGTQRTAGVQNHSITYADAMEAIGIWPGAVAGGPTFVFGKTRGSSPGTYTVVASGDNLGTINFEGADGTDFAVAAQIMAEVDGTPGNDDMPGRLLFKVTPDGSQTPATAITINSTGKTTFKQGSTTAAGVNLGAAASAAPGTPADGDHWYDASGVNWRIASNTRTFNANLWTISALTLAQGDILYATGAGAVTQLAKGTADQVLTMNSGATAPEWVSPAWQVIQAELALTTGVTSQTFSVDFSIYEEVVVHIDNLSASAVGVTNINLYMAVTGTITSGFQITAANYIGGAVMAAADRFGGMYRFYQGNAQTGGSNYYPGSGRAETYGWDASATTFYAYTDSMVHNGTMSATRPNGIVLSIGGGPTINGGVIRIVGRRRVF